LNGGDDDPIWLFRVVDSPGLVRYVYGPMTTAARPLLARLGLAFALLTLATGTVVGSAQADTDEDLADAKSRLSVLEERIGRANDALDALEVDANAVAQSLVVVQARLEIAQDTADRLRREVQAAQSKVEGLQGQLDDRARDVYTNGAASSLEVLLGAATFAEFSARLDYLGRSQDQDMDLVNQVTNEKARLARKQIAVRKLQARLDSDRRDLEQQQRVLQQKLDAASGVLDGLRADQAEAERIVENLADRREREIAAARIAAAGHSHSVTPISGPGPFSVCPVDPPRGYSNDFGAPRSGGRTHQGNDIFAPTGTPIRAPFAGTASDASNSVGGLSVTVYGSQGYVYNAHLSRMGQLGSVSAGTIIGYVGTSGNAAGTSPHDHFEWHPGNGGAVNPYPYLNQVC
jgi:murein DD-endopeptidase MepM/ murein hydrolase activator NlpD